MPITSIYTDGGCVLKNPSEFGGTWAWVSIDSFGVHREWTDMRCIYERNGLEANAKLIKYESGFIPNYLNVKLTNNVMEYVAVIYALEAMEDGWEGTVYSDSEITLGRIFGTWRNKGLEPRLIERKNKVMKRLGNVRGEHVDGHPTKAQLEAGIGKRGNPVSKWNKLADKLCGDESLKVQGVISDTSNNILQY